MNVESSGHRSTLPSGGICRLCRHLDPGTAGVGMRCATFPYGIPFAARARAADHRNPLPGDDGTQFAEKV